ncbi:hypothetical protein RND81_13G119700 [Saponaria officinalis]|uniref:Secreted protein n=1 Tax=Saponaria officinalis TaxID=3572 RepID=A0AAW1H4Z9_SAPOF
MRRESECGGGIPFLCFSFFVVGDIMANNEGEETKTTKVNQYRHSEYPRVKLNERILSSMSRRSVATHP